MLSLCSFLSALEQSQWLHFVSQLLSVSVEVVEAIEEEERPVLVHCSDGWDRTTQVVALAKLMLDPFYRTLDVSVNLHTYCVVITLSFAFQGFQLLVEREWIAFGHRFADRSGNLSDGDPNQQSPIFLQWLDCVYQLLRQFPTAFQFNNAFLVHKLNMYCASTVNQHPSTNALH